MKKKIISQSIHSQPIHVGFLIVIFIAMATIGSAPGIGVNYSDIYREVIAETGFIGLFLYWIITNRRTQTITITLSATRLWFGGLLLLATISGFWAVDIDFFVNKYWLWLASTAVFLLTLGLSVNTKTSISLSRAIVFVGVYISTVGILQALLGFDAFDQAKPPAANFVNKNMASQVVVLIFPLNVFLLLTDKNKYLSSLYPFALTIMLAYVFHTLTRAAWLGVGTEIIFLLAGLAIGRNKLKQAFARKTLHWSREQTWCSIAAFILLLLLVNVSADGWLPVWGVIEQESNSIVSSAQNSKSHRYIIWSATLSMLEQNPLLGSGMGSFYYNGLTQLDNLAGNINGVMRVHNELLELGVELGIIGVIIFLGIVLSLLITLFKLIRQDDAQQQLFYWMIGAALIGGFVNMQFSFPYQMPVPLIIFGIYSALIIKAGDAFGTKIRTVTIPLNPRRWFASVTFFGIIFICTLTLNMIWLASFAQMDDNIRHRRWIDPIDTNALVCSKLITKVLSVAVPIFNQKKHYKFSLSMLNSLNHCAPDSWIYYHLMSQTLLGLNSPYKAIAAIKKALEKHPKGEYLDYKRLYVTYYRTNNRPKARELYQKFGAEPEALLAIQPNTTVDLVAMSVDNKNLQQATKFYQMHVKYHGENAQLKKTYLKLAKQDAAQK